MFKNQILRHKKTLFTNYYKKSTLQRVQDSFKYATLFLMRYEISEIMYLYVYIYGHGQYI